MNKILILLALSIPACSDRVQITTSDVEDKDTFLEDVIEVQDTISDNHSDSFTNEVAEEDVTEYSDGFSEDITNCECRCDRHRHRRGRGHHCNNHGRGHW